MSAPLLSLRNVSKTFAVGNREVRALEDVSLDVKAGECMAVVGESGSGKSTMANLVLGIYPPSAGEILFNGEALPQRRAKLHRRQIQLVQQNPLSSLNPKRSIGASLRLALDVHDIGARVERNDMVRALLEEVRLPADFASRPPSALSGGQRQRVAIARALMLEPEILLLDEPTSALDASVQAETLNLLSRLREERGLTFLMVSHDLAVIDHMCDRVLVMQHGRAVEEFPRADLAAGQMKTDYARSLFAASAERMG